MRTCRPSPSRNRSWMAMAQRNACTAEGNSARSPSPITLKTRPLNSATSGSTTSRRAARSRASVPASSPAIMREYPTTSAARMAARRRCAIGELTRLPNACYRRYVTAKSRIESSRPRFGRRRHRKHAMRLFTRRSTLALPAGAVAAPSSIARATGKTVTIGIDLTLTGADAETAIQSRGAALMAIDDCNADGGPGGWHLNALMLDDGTATTGQYDPAQAATNARKFVADRSVIACVGPQSSTPAKAMAAIFSTANLATLTPSATNPDLTDPAFAKLYRPSGVPVFF